MTDSRPDWPARLAALRSQWHAPGTVCVVSSLTNIAYLTGFRGSAGLFVQSGDSDWLVLDGRYTTVATEAGASGEMAPVPIVTTGSTYEAAVAGLVARTGATRIVFEADHVTVSLLKRWQAEVPGEFVGQGALVEPLRLIKDAHEIAVFRRAGAALAGVAARLGEWVRAGQSERQIAAGIDLGLHRAGFTKPAFDTIVASGPNSAHPHAHPGDRLLSNGDLVVLDFGGVLDGYCVDLTRMAAVGRPGDEAAGIFRAVWKAQQAALDVMRAGVATSAVDWAARQVLDAEGLGAAFVHGTGHGLGLEVHEAPRLSRLSPPDELLRTGMVCTVEPGAYVPGVGGARLEDDVLVTDTGIEILTVGPRDLLTV